MIASLPMYDHPRARAAHDALWDGVRERLGFGPATLDRNIHYKEGWARDDLLLGQICIFPLRTQFFDRVTVVGTSDYGLTDLPPGYFASVFIVRAEDAERGLAPATLGRFAYNDEISFSGWVAPSSHVAAQGMRFHTTLRTGGHLESVTAVAKGEADLASIDAVTWRMLEAWEPAAKDLRVIARTRAAPGQSFITAKGNDPAPLRAALSGAIANLSPEHAATLGLRGIVDLPIADFELPTPGKP